MIRRLTIKTWTQTGMIVLLCLAVTVFLLRKYGLTAMRALERLGLEQAVTEYTNDILGTAMGIFFAVCGLIILAKELKTSVKKRVKQYLAEHPEITLEQLDNDFAAAEEFDKALWIGKRWTYSHKLKGILVDNSKIAWVYSEITQSGRSVYYNLCLALADGTVERIPVSKKKLPQMKEGYEKFPHILVGNNPEYGYMFRNDRKAFLNLRYHQNNSSSV